MKDRNDDERGDFVTAHLLVSVCHSAPILLIAHLAPSTRKRTLTKVEPARKITVLRESQSSKFQSTLPATRSADISPGGLGAASVGLLVFWIARTGCIFNGEAKEAQMLYPLTVDSWLHWLKSTEIEGRQRPSMLPEMPK